GAKGGRIADEKGMAPHPPPPRSRRRGQRTAPGPMPVMIPRSGRCPWRTNRRRPSSVSLSAWQLSKLETSASTACAKSARAPLRKTSVSGSVKVPGCESWKTLVSVTAYHSFAGEVEASNTPTIRRLTPSRRHQLSPIAPSVIPGVPSRGLPEIGGPGTRAETLVGPIDAAPRFTEPLSISLRGAGSGAAHAAPPVHGLRMLATRLGDAAQGAPRAGRAVGKGDVTQREDTHQPLFAVEYGQPAKLDVGHILHDLVEVIVLEAVHYFFAHDVPDRRLRALIGADGADGDVAVGDHADQPVILSDRQHPGVDLSHQARGIADRLIGTGDFDIVGHRFTDLHGSSPHVLKRFGTPRARVAPRGPVKRVGRARAWP